MLIVNVGIIGSSDVIGGSYGDWDGASDRQISFQGVFHDVRG